MDFCLKAIADHKESAQYKRAVVADEYFAGINTTITMADKFITDVYGRKVPDIWSPNHKIKCHLYPYFVIQQVLFLLGNGISFSNPDTLDRLGKDFEHTVVSLAIDAINGGKSFGFWNLDRLVKFSITEYVPLPDEETGVYPAGVRFWRLADDKPLRITLFEPDGYTEYIQRKGEEITIYAEKKPYVQIVSSSVTGEEIAPGEPYPGLPIIPLENFGGESALYGTQEAIDSYDLMVSKLVNNIDNGEFIYWIIKNAPGMEPEDLQEFLQRLKTSGIISTGEGQEVDAHKVEIPFEASESALNLIRKQLFSDFMAFDPQSVAGGLDTATQIRASYEPLNEKTDLFEYQLTKFITEILNLLGIDDKPTYTRSMIVNQQEQIQNIVSSAEYLDSEYATRKILDILGDADQADEVIERKLIEDAGRFVADEEQTEADADIATANEAIDAAEDASGGSLNGAQTQSLITVMAQYASGALTEGQAVAIISTAIGVTKEQARAIIRGE